MALEDVPGLINPIIQAMIATAQLQQRGRESEIDKEKNKEDVKLRQEGLKQALKAIEYQHEHDISQLEATRMLNEAHAKAAVAETQLNWQKFIQGGGDPNKVLEMTGGRGAAQEAQRVLQSGQGLFRQPAPASPGGFPIPQSIQNVLQGPQAQPIPGQNQPVPQIPQDQNLPQNPPIGGGGYGSPDDAIRIAAARAEALERAKGKGGDVEAARKFAYDLSLQAEAASQTKELKKYEAQLVDINKEHANDTHLEAARILAGSRAKNVNPQILDNLIKLRTNGEINLSMTNPIHQAVASAIEEQGGDVSFGPKELAALRKTNELVPVFAQLEKFTNMLPEGRFGALGQKAVSKGAEFVGMNTELLNEWKIARQRAIVIGKALEGMSGGRTSVAQLVTDLESLPADIGITKSDSKTRLTALKSLLDGVRESYLVGMPKWQRDMVVKRNLPNLQASPELPDFLKIAPKTNKAGHTLDQDESVKQGRPVYK